MSTFRDKNEKILQVWFDDERIFIRTDKGNEFSLALEIFPRLKDATPEQRNAVVIEPWGDAMRWEEIDEDIHISTFHEDLKPDHDNEVAALFAKFPQLNVSEVARSIGIHKSLLSQYIYGVKTPSEKRMKEIKEALHTLGLNLIAATA
jgi:hypothetical protein